MAASLIARKRYLRHPQNKKTDVAEYFAVFDHVGVLCNEPSGLAGLLFI
jgi:hypothetical protein